LVAPSDDPESKPEGYALVPERPQRPPSVTTVTDFGMRNGNAVAARKTSRAGFWRTLLRTSAEESSVLQGEIIALVALSAVDLLVTYALLRRGPSFYEANPIAQWFFIRWNIAGMTFFKFSMMSVAIVIGELVERRRRGWGQALLGVSCLATAIVVWQGVKLLFGHGDDGVPLP
jgi:hypothetical protein